MFEARHKFQDDVWGEIHVNDLERDVIDTPEFQRLFRTSQLGFVDLVYPTANHTRGSHSIGACHVASRLMTRLARNTRSRRKNDAANPYSPFAITKAERVLIRLGALLHDISHIPLSHDIERKSHKFDVRSDSEDPRTFKLKIPSHYGHYPKHDDYARNPLLYLLTTDNAHSVLARVLSHYSPHFYALLVRSTDATRAPHLAPFLKVLAEATRKGNWDASQDLLPCLLLHLLIHENPKKAAHWRTDMATAFSSPEIHKWAFGPEPYQQRLHYTWYQPFRHDVIGNTLSADLLDYLSRDCHRLGTRRRLDLHLLNHYVLIRDERLEEELRAPTTGDEVGDQANINRYRCAIDLRDEKRGTVRIVALNDVFRLLDLRHEIHEKAVTHRVVQAASAMLSRALLLMGKDRRPALHEIVRLGQEDHALAGEDDFFQLLLRKCGEPEGRDGQKARNGQSQDPALKDARRILLKLAERRVYRPLMIIPGDRVAHGIFSASNDVAAWETPLRTFAAVVDSAMFSPFLLFVSACVEGMLRGAFDDDLAVCQYARRLASEGPPEAVASAMTVVPSRVIVWATPYKQLHKDPALVVRLGKWVSPIDDILADEHSAQPTLGFVSDRVRQSISNADSQYSTLWKLYIFVSDGLFYTGTYRRLRDGFKVTGDQQRLSEHQDRLERAEKLFIAALAAIHKHWGDVARHRGHSKEALTQILQEPLKPEVFRPLVLKWVSDYDLQQAEQSRAEVLDGSDAAESRASGHALRRETTLSTVDIRHYAHDNCSFDGNCRDIRYKSARRLSASEWARRKDEESEAERSVIRLLEAVGISPEALERFEISEAELAELVECYRTCGAVRDLCRNVPDDLSVNGDLKCLKVFCPTGLPDLQGGEPLGPGPRTAAPDTSVPDGDEFPSTIDQWHNLLTNRVRGLSPHVQERFRTERSVFIEYIGKVDRSRWPEIATDLEKRFYNEARLCNNNIRPAQVVDVLKRRWGGGTADTGGGLPAPG